jgi:uncharacterized cupin superfamily protein
MAEEARWEEVESGLAPATHGWFVVSVRDAAWEVNDAFGAACFFEGENVPFADLGVNVRVLTPGRSRGLYHAEQGQENVLVLAGECLLLVEDEERQLGPWDFVHLPPSTRHALVATGDRSCVLVLAGARGPQWPENISYPRSDVAVRHGAAVDVETSSVVEALANSPRWRLGHPVGWESLPWA